MAQRGLTLYIERTRTGMARKALISFWALRALPARAAHVKRYTFMAEIL